MATLNVQNDYGAAGDGTTDDTDAIQQAINDATSGDEVYLPGGTYLISRRSDNVIHACLDMMQSNGMDDVTFRGDGETTTLKIESGLEVGYSTGAGLMAIAVRVENNSINGLVLEDFVVDVQRDTHTGDLEDGQAISVREGSTDTSSIAFQNIRVENTVGAGFAIRVGGTTVEDCTIDNAYRHGFSSDAPASHGDIVVRRCLVREHAVRGTADYAFDRSQGTGLIEDCVAYDARGNGQGVKTTAETDDVTIRRCRFNSMRNNGVQWAGSSSAKRSKVTLEDVVAENCDNIGVRLGDETDYTIPAGSDVVSTNNAGSYGFWMVNDADITGDGTVYVNYNDSDEAFRAESDATGYLSNFQHTENTSETLTSRSVDLQSTGSELQSDIDGVPTRSEVGAWSGTKDTSDGTEEASAQYQTDFSAYTSGSSLFDTWTSQWSATQDAFSVTSNEPTHGDGVLEVNPADYGRRALSWDDVGDAETVEVAGLVELDAFDPDLRGYCRLCARGGGTAGSEDAYWLNIREDTAFALQKYEGGDVVTFDSGGAPETNVRYWLRLRVEPVDGDTVLKGKYWPRTEPEPSTWSFEATDTSTSMPTSGWVGVGGFGDTLQAFDYVGVGVGGASAPTPDPTTGETYKTDFGTETLGTTPANWTPRLDSTGDNWNVVERSGTYGSQALEFDAASANGHALQWDQLADTVSDVEVLQLVRIPQLDGTEYAGRIRARFGTSGYTAEFGGGEFRVYETGSATTLGTTGNPEPDTWYWMRFRLNGDSLKLRTWELFTTEPGTWDIDVTDTANQSGWVGVGSYQARLTEWGWVSAATNGETAPMPSEALSRAVMDTVGGSLQSTSGVIETR